MPQGLSAAAARGHSTKYGDDKKKEKDVSARFRGHNTWKSCAINLAAVKRVPAFSKGFSATVSSEGTTQKRGIHFF